MKKKSKKTVKETISPFQSKLLTFIEQTGCNDSDKQFLLSLLPDYKNLNDSQKLDFRIYALNFFKNIHQSNNNGSSSLTYDHLYQHSSSTYLPPHRQPDINNTYYSNTSHNIPPPYIQPVVYPPVPQSSFSHFQQDVAPHSSFSYQQGVTNATFSQTKNPEISPLNTSLNK
uniref:BESS domain-containing protein n=1 Tax=Schizaphis graminum TaxID=13262 RepID=A0A2S2NPG6_SCHGA